MNSMGTWEETGHLKFHHRGAAKFSDGQPCGVVGRTVDAQTGREAFHPLGEIGARTEEIALPVGGQTVGIS